MPEPQGMLPLERLKEENNVKNKEKGHLQGLRKAKSSKR